MKELFVIFGSQLFQKKYLKKFKNTQFYMAEDYGLCTYFKFHKHKIIHFLASMRNYTDELSSSGFSVDYLKIENNSKKEKAISYEDKL